MMAEEQAVLAADSAPAEGEGKYEPPIMGEVCDPAAIGALRAVSLGQPDDGWVGEHVTAALWEHWDSVMLAGAESCARKNFAPQAVYNRWLERLGAEERERLGFDYSEMEPFFDLYAALLSRMWGWLTRRRMLAEMRAERMARPAERLRWVDAEPIVRTALGAAYQPPDTPEKREALRRWAEKVKASGGKPTKAMTAWIEAWRTKPEKRATLIARALAWKDD